MTAVAKVEELQGAPLRTIDDRSDAPGSIMGVISAAVDKNVPVETIERLVALKYRDEERRAAQAFFTAMAAFQAECPPIKRSGKVDFTGQGSGTRVKYTFAELDEIARTVNPILSRHGLSYTWDSTVTGTTLTCVCTVRHIAGHSVPASFVSPIEGTKGMSGPQQVASALTFAKRQSLSSALGLTTTDDDVDGASVEDAKKITDDQAIVLSDLIGETGADIAAVLRFAEVQKISDVRAADYRQIVAMLEKKKAAK